MTIENLEEIATILDLKCAAKIHLNSTYGTMVTDSIKTTEKTND